MENILKRKWALPKRWCVILFVIAVVGIILILCNPQLPDKVNKLSSITIRNAWSILIGIYLISIVITHLFVFYSSRVTNVLLNLTGEETNADLWPPTLVGICESIMYPSLFLLGKRNLSVYGLL